MFCYICLLHIDTRHFSLSVVVLESPFNFTAVYYDLLYLSYTSKGDFKIPDSSNVYIAGFCMLYASHEHEEPTALSVHYENLPMQYTVIFKFVKNEKFQ